MTMRITDPFAGLEEIVQENHPLAPHTWYRIGGPARYFVTPRSVEELQLAVQRCGDYEIPVYILGLGANLLVGDAGVDGAVFRLDSDFFRQVTIEKNLVTVHAGYDMQKLVLRTCRAGLAGLECLAGIPGTLGGGIRMNAGGKFGDIGASVQNVTVMDSAGTIFHRTKDDLVFDYRSTNISAPFILSATLELQEDDPEEISKRTKEIWMYKRNSQPLNTKNCGCIFKNPRGLSAGALIDQAGLKGFRVGGAEISAKHANFIIAHPDCKADDVMRLVKIIKEKVWDKNQIHLESEVRIWP
ncbi:MAG TPA: UDP-N-acetylmuramate dehydrogenase [Tepidisphaeraceae bacterium]|nr:UDP-N-acetylmuramate dehydrogenase [Tepidisphaeraceae bacterium]